MRDRGNPVLKMLDRYVGIPVVFLLGLFRRKQKLPLNREGNKLRFVVLKTAAIGDTILTEAILHEIHSAYPDADITYICTKTNEAMAACLPYVNKIYIFSLKNPFKGFCDVRKLGTFDYLLDFASWNHINGIITYFIRARFKIGFQRKNMYRHYIYDRCIQHTDDCHELDNYRKLLSGLEMKVQGYVPSIDFSGDAAMVLEQWKLTPHQYVIFHLFAGGSRKKLKEWPLDNWVKLAESIFAFYGNKILFTGGSADYETVQKLVMLLQEKGIDAECLAGQVSLAETGTILQQAKLLITIDTGIMHLGAAVHTPLVSLHGPVSAHRWGPVGEQMMVNLAGTMKCGPCINLGFESMCKDPLCMKRISVQDVLAAVREICGT